MPVTTSKLALPTPVTADNNDTPTYMLNLANAIVSSLDFGLFSARPAASTANQGRRYYATDRDREYFNTAAGTWIPLGGTPPGAIAPFLRSTSIPTGWLLLDGTTYTGALTLYPDLWAELPSAYKSGSDFVSPDLRASGVIGADNFGLGSAGARGNLIGLAVGNTTGANTKTLTVAQLPSHTHDMAHNHTINATAAGGHFHSVGSLSGSAGNDGLAQLAQVYGSGSNVLWVPSSLTTAGSRIQTYPISDHVHGDTLNAFIGNTLGMGSGSSINFVALNLAVVFAIRT